MKLFSPRAHALVDFALVGLFALGPTLFGFGGQPATVCLLLAFSHLAISLFTDYPLGVVKLLPFNAHCVELLMAVSMAAAPWMLHFEEVRAARNFFVGTAALLAALFVLSDYQTPQKAGSQPAPNPH